MVRRRVRPLTACTFTAAVLLGTVAMPGFARADDGTVDSVASAAALTEAPASIVDEALEVAEEQTPAVVPIESLDPPAEQSDSIESPESSQDEAVPEASVAEPVADPVTKPDPAAQDASTVDTTPIEDDTASDTPPSTEEADLAEPPPPVDEAPTAAPPPAASGSPVSGSTAAANVNVSVRIGSPGDNGSVTQGNVAGEPPPTTEDGGDTTSSAATDASRKEPVVEKADTWYWRWDCLGLGSQGAISLPGSTRGSIPTSWTWIWNCDHKYQQYQGERNSGYQQTNANVSIRIESPGADGSVTQVNLGAGVRISPSIPSLPSLPVEAPPFEPPSLPLELDDALELPTAPVVVGDIALPPLTSAPDSTLPTETLTEAAAVPSRSGRAHQSAAARVPIGAALRASWPTAQHPRAATKPAILEQRPPTVSVSDSTAAAASGAVSRPSLEAAPRKRPAPRWRQTPPERSASAPLSTSSAAAVAGGGGSGSGLPFLLALPFVAALLDLARRVVLERATWPSGHRRRVLDRPG